MGGRKEEWMKGRVDEMNEWRTKERKVGCNE